MRKATYADIPFLNATMRLSKAHWAYDQAFMDAFMHKYSIDENYLDHHDVTLLCKEGDLIGYFSFTFHEDHTLELDHFFLHPSYIGKGLGKRLWKECCLVAIKLGATEFTLWSDPEAEPFYAKMGCEKIGVKQSPFMPDRYPPIMRYKLPAR